MLQAARAEIAQLGEDHLCRIALGRTGSAHVPLKVGRVETLQLQSSDSAIVSTVESLSEHLQYQD